MSEQFISIEIETQSYLEMSPIFKGRGMTYVEALMERERVRHSV